MNYFVGIDNSSLDHKVHVIDENGNNVSSFSVKNDLPGFEQIRNKLRGFNIAGIGFELPHGPLVDFLYSQGFKLFSINPLKIKRFKETFTVSGNKNDMIDAEAIAEYLLKFPQKIRQLRLNSSEIEKLKNLTIIHNRLINDRCRHINKLHFAVRQYFPLHETLFTDFGGIVQLSMLQRFPTFDSLSSKSDKQIREFLTENRYRKPVYIDRLIRKIREYRQFIPSEVEQAYQVEVKCLCRILIDIRDAIKEIESEMSNITGSHPQGVVFQSLPGAGILLSAELLSIFGDEKNRFQRASNAQCLFGTAPKNYQSGNYHKVIMRKACNKLSRTIMYRFAFSSLRFSPWARKYYDMQRAKGKTNSVAIRALSNKWVKVIFKMWKDNLCYKEELRFQNVA